jgi:hypothetical protein
MTARWQRTPMPPLRRSKSDVTFAILWVGVLAFSQYAEACP